MAQYQGKIPLYSFLESKTTRWMFSRVTEYVRYTKMGSSHERRTVELVAYQPAEPGRNAALRLEFEWYNGDSILLNAIFAWNHAGPVPVEPHIIQIEDGQRVHYNFEPQRDPVVVKWFFYERGHPIERNMFTRDRILNALGHLLLNHVTGFNRPTILKNNHYRARARAARVHHAPATGSD